MNNALIAGFLIIIGSVVLCVGLTVFCFSIDTMLGIASVGFDLYLLGFLLDIINKAG